MTKLTESALLVTLSASEWMATKADRGVGDEVAKAHQSNPAMGVFTKRLLSSTALGERRKVVNEARAYHYSRTLPWLDNGNRLLPCPFYTEYLATMRGYRVDAEEFARKFCDSYEEQKLVAQRELGTLYNEADYPSIDVIASKFDFKVRCYPVPTVGDWRVKIADSELAEVKADMEESLLAAKELVLADLWGRLDKQVTRFVERVNNPENTFRAATVDNLRELVVMAPTLNIVGDDEFGKVIRLVKEKLCAESADTLRANPLIRQEVADEATAILDRIRKFSKT